MFGEEHSHLLGIMVDIRGPPPMGLHPWASIRDLSGLYVLTFPFFVGI